MAKSKKISTDGLRRSAASGPEATTANSDAATSVAAPPIVFTPDNESTNDWALPPLHRRVPWPLRTLGWVLLIGVGVAVVSTFVYANKALPGVSVDGTKISGLGRSDAITAVSAHLDEFKGQLIPINYGDANVQINPTKLETSYNIPAAVDLALDYGRNGGWAHRAYEQLRALLGRSTNVASYQFNDGDLTPYLSQIDDATYSAVTDASFNISGTSVTVNAARPGQRLDRGYLVMQVQDRLATSSLDPITAPIGQVAPLVDTAGLEAVKDQATTYVAGALTLTSPTTTYTVTPDQIVPWIKVNRSASKTFDQTLNVADIYANATPITLSLDNDAITKYVADLASKIDQAGQNAVLAMQNGQLTVIQASQAGQALDQTGLVTAIKASLIKPASERNLTLNVKVSQPDVTESSLASLGIKELISEGATTFPGSPADRITNIKVGTSKFNQVLIKPGATFSFGQYLGDVDAANGYKPGLAIVGNKIEPQYGGGLCQVSSTMYRAALLAGLPITERVNHAYAVGYYTAPYGVPGVDATIYEPQVDLQFINDTGSYILIQSILDLRNSSLKFDFYGTKTKSGAIRGPYFVTGSNDETKPSTTVFYRDVLDLAGNVIKTDTVTTHYASSLDFTEVKTPGLD